MMILNFVIFLLCCGNGIVVGESYTNEFAVEILGGMEVADRVAAELDCENRGLILKDVYHFFHRRVRKRSTEIHEAVGQDFKRHESVIWYEQQRVLSRQKRQLWTMSGPPPVQPMNTPQYFGETGGRIEFDDRSHFNDKRWDQMWYLNRGNRLDMNVQSAWANGATGKGVYVTILDDGIERSHPDLQQNYDPQSSYDVNENDDDPSPRYDFANSNRHGTRCAGEVAATANNSNCAVGIAYNAGIGGVRMLDGDVTDAVEARSLQLNNQHVDIYSASWGPDDDGKTVDGPGRLATKAFIQGISQGRGGKGSIFVWASGNGGRDHDNCNCDGYTNSVWTLSVSSATENGLIPWYSEACSSTLASTYSSGAAGERKVVTTDLHHACTSSHTGTSASAPLAAGIFALVLEVNPDLTWRDVQHITIRCAHRANLRESDWAVNAVGRNFSHSFGYGIMDADCMVKLARKWKTVPQQLQAIISGDKRTDAMIPGKTTVASTLEVTEAGGIEFLEHVQAHVTLSSTRRGDVIIYLISPSGTRTNLLAKRPRDYSRVGFNDWPFLTVHTWEESPIGTWKLEVTNEGRSMAELKEWSLSFLGTRDPPQPSSHPKPVSSSTPSPTPSFSVPSTVPPTNRKTANEDRFMLDNCLETDGKVRGWCSSCKNGFILHNGRCVDKCPQNGFYPGKSNHKHTCLPCYYSCKTCSGPNDYECTSCYGDAKFLEESKEKYCVNKSLMDRIFSSSRWYYFLSLGFILNLILVLVLIVYILRTSKRSSGSSVSAKYSPVKLSETLSALPNRGQLKAGGGNINHSLSSVPFRDYESSSEDEAIFNKPYSDEK